MKSCFLKAISTMLCCGELTDIIIGTYGIVLSIVFCLWCRLMLWQEDSRKVKIPFWLLDPKICKYSNSTLTEQLIINASFTYHQYIGLPHHPHTLCSQWPIILSLKDVEEVEKGTHSPRVCPFIHSSLLPLHKITHISTQTTTQHHMLTLHAVSHSIHGASHPHRRPASDL